MENVKRRKATPLDAETYKGIAELFWPLGTRACPFYRRTRRGYEVIGTGIPVRGQKYAALVTASHVLDEFKNDQHVVIGGSGKLLRIPVIAARFSHSQPAPVVDVDVAAIALPAAGVGELAEFYDFTTAADLGEFEDYDKLTLYGFVGCPHTKNREKPGSQEGKVRPYFYVAREYAALPEDRNKIPWLHKALIAPLDAVNGPDGRLVSAPNPHGISGCGVWKVKLDRSTGVASAPKLAGVGIEYHAKAGVFIATDSRAAAIAISELWKQLDEGRTWSTKLDLTIKSESRTEK